MYHDDKTVIRDRKSNIIYKDDSILFVHPQTHQLVDGVIQGFTVDGLVRVLEVTNKVIDRHYIGAQSIIKI